MALSYNPHTIIFNLIQPYTILVFVKKIDWRFETFILLFAIFANLLFISVQIVIGWCAFKKIHLIFVMSFFCIRFSNLNYIIFVGFLHFRFLFFFYEWALFFLVSSLMLLQLLPLLSGFYLQHLKDDSLIVSFAKSWTWV